MFVLWVSGWWIISYTTCPMCITFVGWTSEWLGSHVGEHLFRFDMFCLGILTFLSLLTKGCVDAEVFCSWGHSAGGGDGFYRFIVLVDGDRLGDVVVDGSAEVTEDFGSEVCSAEASKFGVGGVE